LVAAKYIYVFTITSALLFPAFSFADTNDSLESLDTLPISDILEVEGLSENDTPIDTNKPFYESCLPVDKMAVEVGPAGRWFTPGRPDNDLKYIVLHSTESEKEEGYADRVANWLSRTEYRASTHFVVGPDKILQTVDLYDTAWGVGSIANSYSIQIEILGRASYSRDEWTDEVGRSMLCKVSYLIAILSKQYDIPITRIKNEGVREGLPGIAGHYVFSETLGGSDHTDPGDNFPWDLVLGMSSIYLDNVYLQLSEDAIKPDVPLGFIEDGDGYENTGTLSHEYHFEDEFNK
jgi:hypothetical protein